MQNLVQPMLTFAKTSSLQEDKAMHPLRVGLFLRRFSKWSINILSFFMVVAGAQLAFSGDDQDDNMIGAANVILGVTLFSLVED